MATKVQRSKAIADALINSVATSAQINKLGRAFALYQQRLVDYDNSATTAEQKAGILLEGLRSAVFGLVRRLDKHNQETALAALPEPEAGFPEAP